MDPAALACFAPSPSSEAGTPAAAVPGVVTPVPGAMVKLPAMGALSCRRTLRSVILDCVCAHRRHLRLDNMRTLILADNRMTRIQLSTDDDGGVPDDEEAADSELLGTPTAARHQVKSLAQLA